MTIEFARTLTSGEVCIFLLAGGAGGLVRHLLSRGGLILPSWKRVGDEILVRGGFLSSVIIGAGVGLLVDHNIATAFGYGVSGPYILEKIAQRAATAFVQHDGKNGG